MLGDDTGLGKTLEAVGALCYIWDREKDVKAIVVTIKSAKRQWVSEFHKFTVHGDKVQIVEGTPKKRAAMYEAFSTGECQVIVINYHLLVNDYTKILMALRRGENDYHPFALILDEISICKNHRTKFNKVCGIVAGKAVRVWGLSATLLKNRLEEGFGIYKVLVPGLFKSHSAFLRELCITKLQNIGGGRKVPIVVGHSKSQIAKFKSRIDPYFLGRSKHEVGEELPDLVSVIIECPMTRDQTALYRKAMTGSLTDAAGEELSDEPISMLQYCQQIANSPTLLGYVAKEDPKVDTLLDLLSGDYADHSVIVFSRFRKMIDIVVPKLLAIGRKVGRITGSENEKQRSKCQEQFQSKVLDTICVTNAGTEAINLYAASILIFIDTLWSYGDYLQVLGRAVRIGSVHSKVLAVHLTAVLPHTLIPKSVVNKVKVLKHSPIQTTCRRFNIRNAFPTIDHNVLMKLAEKKELIEPATGKATPASLNFSSSDMNDIVDSIRESGRLIGSH